MITTKHSILFVSVFLITSITFCQKKVMLDKNVDIWSGKYRVVPFSNDSLTEYKLQHFIIERIKDAKPEDVVGKYETDLMRWTIKLESQPDIDKEEVHRFLFNDDDDDYAEFEWTDLHKKDKMHCINGGNFFICKTLQNTDVIIGNETLHTDTGIFGILLHHGPFQLYELRK